MDREETLAIALTGTLTTIFTPDSKRRAKIIAFEASSSSSATIDVVYNDGTPDFYFARGAALSDFPKNNAGKTILAMAKGSTIKARYASGSDADFFVHYMENSGRPTTSTGVTRVAD